MKKFRTLPRAYDLAKLARYLDLLHIYPVPLVEMDTRKMESRLQTGRLSREVFDSVVSWKTSKGIQSSEESEYRYLMRDLGLVSTRPIDLEVDGVLPLGGDGPVLSTLGLDNKDTKIFFLSRYGEKMIELYQNNRSFYEDYLFWLILRNGAYLPLLQQIISNPASYTSDHVEKLIYSADSTSVNSALSWSRYLGIINREEGRCQLITSNLGARLFSASVLEINANCVGNETWYVKDVVGTLENSFNLTLSAVDFILALDLIFAHTSRDITRGYGSSRGDLSLRRHAAIQMLQFLKEIPLSISREIDSSETLRMISFAQRSEQ